MSTHPEFVKAPWGANVSWEKGKITKWEGAEDKEPPCGLDFVKVALNGAELGVYQITDLCTGKAGWIRFHVLDAGGLPVLDEETGTFAKATVYGLVECQLKFN